MTLLAVFGAAACTPTGASPPPEPEPAPPPLRRSASGLPARALADAPTASGPAAPIGLTASDGTGLKLVSFSAKAVVQGPLAFTELHLTFDNPEDRTREGRFAIDLPDGAAISRFAMKIDDRWQEGEVVERKAAQRVYEDFLHRRQDPALLENQAGNRFSARVFPIPAAGRKELVVSYSQTLPSSDEAYRLPLRGLPELERFDAEIRTEGGAGTTPGVVHVAHTHWTPDRDLEATALAAPVTGLRNDTSAVARVRVTGEDDDAALDDLTILFDTSASRAIGFADKVRHLGDLVAALRRGGDFRLRVVAFDQDASLMFDGRAADLGDDDLDALYTRRPLGASDPAGALRRAGGLEPGGRILLMTDGIATAGAADTHDLVAAARELAARGAGRIDAIVDEGNRDDDVLAALVTARDGDEGIVARAGLPVAALAAKLRRATMHGVKIEVEGARFSWPNTLDGVQPGDEVLVYAELPKGRTMHVTLTDDDATVTTDVSLATVEGPLVERATVGARIDALTVLHDGIPADDEKSRTLYRNQVVALSTEHRVMSDFTALLVLETEADYDRYDLDRTALTDILTVGPSGLAWTKRTGPVLGASGSTPPDDDPDDDPDGDAIPQLAEAFDSGQRHKGEEGMMGVPTPRADDEDVWGSLQGDEIGESYGVGGLGLVGTGRGGGGTGEGTIGLGNHGLIGRGAGGATGADDGGGRGAAWGGRGKRVPTVRMSKGTVTGPLDRDIVRRIVRAHINEIRGCYNQALTRDPSAAGRVEIGFTIGPDGKVATSAVAGSTLDDDDATKCMARAVKRWKFPRPTGGASVEVEYPFVVDPRPGAPTSAPLTEAERTAQAERFARLVRAEAAAQRAREARAAEIERTKQSPYEGRMFDVMSAIERNDDAEALHAAMDWVDTTPGDTMALLALGEALEHRGQRHAAARAYGSLVDLYPSRADLRRYAGTRLEALGDTGRALAIDTYRRAVEQRPDHPSGHRMLAYAYLRAGEYEPAMTTIVEAAQRQFPRFREADRILREDAGLIAAAWMQAEPARALAIRLRASEVAAEIPTAPSTRFVLSWETDANDVDFHVYDAGGGHAYYSQMALPSGGTLYADITTGYGPECFAIVGEATAYPYRLEANYFARGPMGYGMGTVQVIEHDGEGNLFFDDRPFVIMKDHATVDLGTLEHSLAVAD